MSTSIDSSQINELAETIADKLSEQKELQFIDHGITETLEGENIEVKVSIYEGKKFTIERLVSFFFQCF